MESLTVHELRRCIRDLFGLTMLPALWRQTDAQQIAESLADVVFRTLELDVLYVVVPGESDPHTCVRVTPDLDYEAGAIAKCFATIVEERQTTSRIEFLGTEMSVLLHPIELRGHAGAIVAARSGSTFPTEVERALLRAAANQATVALENALYVAELARAALAREQLVAELADASRRKDEFLAVLGHELRNPLAAIQAAHTRSLVEPGHGRAREIITHQLATLMRLVDDLLDVSRVSTGKLALQKEMLDLRAVVERAHAAAEHAAARMRHTLVIDIPNESLWVEGDAVRLEQVIANIVANAVKYSPDGGRISITASRTPDRHAILRVDDDGCGIAPELLPRICEPFVQADTSLHRTAGGLGLGLALVKGVVELHRGDITVSSEGPGKGCSVIVRLPLADPAVAEPRATASAVVRPGAALRVLLVDDNVDMTEMLAAMLEASGHETASANDGAEAIELAVRFGPDVAFVDIGLPSLDGYEVGRRLRRQLEDRVALIAMSGYGQDEDRARSRAAGFDDHLVKPVPPDRIKDLLARIAASQRPR
jgi:signal transduction histidine kinase/ActR/RegA family two-component response regulator